MTDASVFQPDDVYRLVAAGRVKLHPGERLGAIIATAAIDSKSYRSHCVWVRRGAGLEANPAVEPDVVDFGWSPAGDRYYKVTLHDQALELTVGRWDAEDAAAPVDAAFRLNGQPDRVAWSADGTRIAFTTKVRPAGVSEDSGHLLLRGIHPFKREPQGFHDGAFRQVILGEFADGRGWTFRQITSGDLDRTMPDVSPDGRLVTYVRSVPGVKGYYGEELIAAYDLGTGEERTLVQIGGPCWYPTWDREGRRLAWLGHDSRMGSTEGTDVRLMLLDTQAGAHWEISTGFGRSIEDVIVDDSSHAQGGPRPIAWVDGDQALLAIASDGGVTSVWRFDATTAPGEGGRITQAVGGPRRIVAFDSAADSILVAYASPEDPSRVALFSGGTETVVYAPNTRWLETRRIAPTVSFAFRGARGDRIEGWAVSPATASLQGAPCIVQVNRGRFGWSFYLEPQILAGAGFAVAYINPHGSYGYGEVFRASTHYDPATLEVDDVMMALDHLGTMGVDLGRLGVNGTSFGGFLVNWLVSHYPERIAAAVAQASYCNRHSLWGTSSIGPSRWDRPGPPWKHAEFLLSRSPLTYVENVRIPMLLIHGERDTICPLEQAEQWYTALAMRGLDPTWLILKGEAHDLARTARPQSRVLRMSAILEWFRQRLAPTGPTAVSLSGNEQAPRH